MKRGMALTMKNLRRKGKFQDDNPIDPDQESAGLEKPPISLFPFIFRRIKQKEASSSEE